MEAFGRQTTRRLRVILSESTITRLELVAASESAKEGDKGGEGNQLPRIVFSHGVSRRRQVPKVNLLQSSSSSRSSPLPRALYFLFTLHSLTNDQHNEERHPPLCRCFGHWRICVYLLDDPAQPP